MKLITKFRISEIIMFGIFGLYFINKVFNFIMMPEFINSIDSWIIFFGACMLFYPGMILMKKSKKGLIISLPFIILGIYWINYIFKLISIPEFISGIESELFLISGIGIILGVIILIKNEDAMASL